MAIISLSEQVMELATRKLNFSDVEFLPERIRKLLGDPNTLLDPERLEEVLSYTTSNSKIAAVLHRNPASDEMLRIVYPDFNGHQCTEGLDCFLSQSLSGQALRDRLKFCSTWIAQNFINANKRVIDLGGGSGSYAFESMNLLGTVPDNFVWDCLDLDPDAIRVGNDRARAINLQDTIVFRHGNFMSESSVGVLADYGVLIGVLCGMDNPTAQNCLVRSAQHLKVGGEIFVATLLKKSFDEDPRTFRILCNVGGWQLRPKPLLQVEEIFASAGYRILNIFSERPSGPGQYAIVHAQRL